MTWVYASYAGTLWATAAVAVIAAWMTARKPRLDGSVSLIGLLWVIAGWALLSGVESASADLAHALFWAKAEVFFSLLAPTLMLLFVLAYSQHKEWLSKRNFALFSFFILAGWVAALTNGSHHLIWTHFQLDPTEPGLVDIGYGWGHYVLLSYRYLLVLVSLIILVKAWFKATSTFRWPLVLLMVGTIFPLVTGLFYFIGINPFGGLDISPISFMAASLFLVIGFLRNQFFDLSPIRSEALIDHMLDGVIVLDAWERVAKFNSSAQGLIPTLKKAILGKPASQALPFWTQIQKKAKPNGDILTEIELPQASGRFLETRVSNLLDGQGHSAGKLMTLRDITERHETKKKLARNIEELKIINRISLVVTAGLDMERILRTLFEHCSQVAPVDVFYVALCEPNATLVNIPLYYEEGHYLSGAARDIRENPGLIGSIINTGVTLYLRDNIKQVTHPVLRPNAIPGKTSRSYIGIPLTVRNQVIGVMSIQNEKPNAYSDDQVRLLERIALQAAIAIENARLYAQEQRLAILDELTGVYNYRGLMELGEREVDRARRFSHPLSVLFFDIDGFRNLNNTYSHTAGNIVLQTVVKRCSSLLRSVDILARFGGDEFIVLLPETDQANAEAVARRLVEIVSTNEILTSYGNLHTSISVGVASFYDPSLDLLGLIDRANKAEHFSKQSPKTKVNTAPLS